MNQELKAALDCGESSGSCDPDGCGCAKVVALAYRDLASKLEIETLAHEESVRAHLHFKGKAEAAETALSAEREEGIRLRALNAAVATENMAERERGRVSAEIAENLIKFVRGFKEYGVTKDGTNATLMFDALDHYDQMRGTFAQAVEKPSDGEVDPRAINCDDPFCLMGHNYVPNDTKPEPPKQEKPR